MIVIVFSENAQRRMLGICLSTLKTVTWACLQNFLCQCDWWQLCWSGIPPVSMNAPSLITNHWRMESYLFKGQWVKGWNTCWKLMNWQHQFMILCNIVMSCQGKGHMWDSTFHGLNRGCMLNTWWSGEKEAEAGLEYQSLVWMMMRILFSLVSELSQVFFQDFRVWWTHWSKMTVTIKLATIQSISFVMSSKAGPKPKHDQDLGQMDSRTISI